MRREGLSQTKLRTKDFSYRKLTVHDQHTHILICYYSTHLKLCEKVGKVHLT